MGRYRKSSCQVEVDVEFDYVLPEVPTEMLAEELASRGATTHRDTVRTAIAQIQRGDTLDAITTLEREFFPKWASVFESRAAYEAATNPHVQPLKGQGPMGNYFAKALGASIAAAKVAGEVG